MSQDNSIITFSDAALTIASAAAKASGPPWDAAAPAATALKDVLDYFFGGMQSPSPVTIQQIAAQLAQQSVNTTIRSARTSINTTLTTFLVKAAVDIPLPASVNAAVTGDPEGEFTQFYKFLESAVTGSDTTKLTDPIGMMTQPADPQADICVLDADTQAAYLGTFAYGVSVYALLALYWASLVVSVDGKIDATNSSIGEAVNRLQGPDGSGGWIDYATAAQNAFTDKVNARLAEVGTATPYSWTEDLFSKSQAMYFTDGEPVAGFDPTTVPTGGLPEWPGTIDIGGGALTGTMPQGAVYAVAMDDDDAASISNAAQSFCAAYRTAIQQQLYQNYFDPGVVGNAVSEWQSAVTRLQSLLPS